MGIWDAFNEIVEAVTPWSVVEAEAPASEVCKSSSIFPYALLRIPFVFGTLSWSYRLLFPLT